MIGPRRAVGRFANVGLLVFGLAVVVVLGTGGTRIDLGVRAISLWQIAPPFAFLCLFASLRLLAASRHSGLEARLVTLFARQGLPPRDAPATVVSGATTGALLGLGGGFVVAAGDVVRLVMGTPAPGPSPDHLVLLGLIVLGVGLFAGALLGAACGGLIAAAARLAGHPPGRYEAGRWTVAALLLAAPVPVRVAPALAAGDGGSAMLLAVAGTAIVAGAFVFVFVPVAVARARRGHWALAASAAAVLGLGAAAAAMLAVGPSGFPGAARDTSYPNVLLVSISGLRTDVTGLGRGPQLTPSLGGVARRGAWFRAAISPSTDLAAASTSVLTGLYPASHGLRGPGDQLRPGIEGLPLVLAGHGFRTAAFVSSRRLEGRTTGLAGMFETFDDPTSLRDWLDRTALGRLAPGRARDAARDDRPDDLTVGAFRDWVSGLRRGPWFAWVELAGPLRPGPDTPPAESARPPGLFLPQGSEPVPTPPAWAGPAAAGRPLVDWTWGYVRAARAADQALEALLQVVAMRGEQHRTLVVVLSEQGLPIGESDAWFDAPAGLDLGVVQVPWVLAGSAVWPGTAVPGPCSLVDVTPTTLGLIGVESGEDSEGEDLSRYLVAGGAAVRDPQKSGPVFSEMPRPEGAGWRPRSVQLGGWRLLRDTEGMETLFLVQDGEDAEIPAPRGRDERQRQILSDELTRRQAAEGVGGDG